MEETLLGKVAFITGAGYGEASADGALDGHAPNMGVAIAQCLAQMGAVVVATDINGEAVGKTIETLQKRDGNPPHAAMKLDVTKADEIRTILNRIHEQYGALDIVCNNAGVSSMAPLEELTEEEWDFNVCG